MSEILLKSSKFRVERRHCAVRDRPPVVRDIVVHPGAVIVLPVLTDTDIVVIHNYRYSVGRELVELPAGTLEPGEDPSVCAARELEEEAGYRTGRLESMGEFYTSPGITDELMRCFVAYNLEPVPQRLEGGEQIRPEVISLARAIEWIREGRIVDGKTVALLLRYRMEKEAC